MSEWQPIATAPRREGERVIISDGKRVTTAVWIVNIREYWEDVDRNTRKRVVSDDSYWAPDDEETYCATHWMPLPPPPSVGLPEQ